MTRKESFRMNYKQLVFLAIILIALNQTVIAGIEVNWIDTFADSSYIATNNNINVSDGYAHLMNSQSRGNITSVAIPTYSLTNWGMFYIQSGGLGDGNTNLSFGFLRSDLTPILECYANSSYLNEQEVADSIAKNFAGTGAFDGNWLSGTILSLTANYTVWQNFTIIPDVTTNATYNGTWSIEQDKEDAHNCSGTFDSSCTNAFDEDWTTFTDTTYGDSGTIFENFTIPSETSKANFTYYGNSGSVYCYNSSNEWTSIISAKNAIGLYTGDIPLSCLLTSTLQIETSVSNGVINRVYYEGKVIFSGENSLEGILSKDIKYINPYWVLKYKSDTAVWNISCWNNNSNSWYPLSYDNSHNGETTTSFKIPYSCIYRNSILYLYENMDNVGSGAIYYEDKISWNVTSYKAINISTAALGFNTSACLGTQSLIHLFAFWEGNSSSPLLLDWNVTYFQSESSCYDYDGGLNYNIGSNVTKAGFTYKDSCTSSTLTEYYCDLGIVKSSSYTCPQVCQDSTRCRGDCIGNVSAWSYYLSINSSQTQYIKFNLSQVPNVKSDLRNVISYKQSWEDTPYILVVNVTGSADVSIYLSDDITNIAYATIAHGINLTLQLTLANFTRINPYYNISWWIEENWTQPFTNSIYFDNETNITTTILDHKFYVYCPTSGTGYINMKQVNTTSIIIANPERPLNFLSQIDWTSNSTYTRSYVPYADTENISMFLIDWRNYAVVAVTFNLVDLSYSFDNAIIRLQKYVEGEKRDQHSDFFDATDTALAYLIENGKYIVEIVSGNISNTFGWITATSSDTSKTVVVSAVFQSYKMQSPYDFINLQVSANTSTGMICLYYNDSHQKTNYVTFIVSNASNYPLYNVTTTSSVSLSCYVVPKLNATYLWRATISHQEGSIFDIGQPIDFWGTNRKIHILEDNGITDIIGFTPTQIYKFISLIAIIGLACLFGSVDAYTGAVVTGCSTVFFFYLGWLDISFINVCVIFVLAIMGKLREGKGV